MNKNLPKVYANPINKELRNNKEVYTSGDAPKIKEPPTNISHKINEIFSNLHHVYKSNVEIITKDFTINTTIVGKTSTDLLTLNGEKIAIKDIIDITRI